jgi:acyl carrier protein
VLGLDPAAVPPEAPFRSLGLDSLLSIELRNRLAVTFGLELSPTILWIHRTPRAVATALCSQLAPAGTPPA